MTFYEQLVTETQMSNYSRYYSVYASGGTPVPLTKKRPLPYHTQVKEMALGQASGDRMTVFFENSWQENNRRNRE